MIEFFIAFFFIIFVVLIMSFGVIFLISPLGILWWIAIRRIEGKCDICGETKPCDENQRKGENRFTRRFL